MRLAVLLAGSYQPYPKLLLPSCICLLSHQENLFFYTRANNYDTLSCSISSQVTIYHDLDRKLILAQRTTYIIQQHTVSGGYKLRNIFYSNCFWIRLLYYSYVLFYKEIIRIVLQSALLSVYIRKSLAAHSSENNIRRRNYLQLTNIVVHQNESTVSLILF